MDRRLSFSVSAAAAPEAHCPVGLVGDEAMRSRSVSRLFVVEHTCIDCDCWTYIYWT
jgi:hypothetical protein